MAILEAEERSLQDDIIVVFPLDILISPKLGNKRNLSPDNKYRIFRYTRLKRKYPCFLCGRDEKAKNIISYRDEETGLELESGLDCLELNFPISRSQLFKSASVLDPLVKDWVQIVSELNNAPGKSFYSSDEALQDMLVNIGRIEGFQCQATLEARALLQELLNNVGGISQGFYDSKIIALNTYLAIQRENKLFKPLFDMRRQYFLDHPSVLDNNRKIAELIFNQDPASSLDTFFGLYSLSEKLQKKNLPTKIDEFPPFKVSRAMYEENLRTFLRTKADQLQKTPSASRNFQDKILDMAYKVHKNGGYVVDALASHDPGRLLSFEADTSDPIFKSVQIYLSSFSKPYKHAGITLDKRGRTKYTGKQEEGYYIGVVAWIPERYYDAYEEINILAKRTSQSFVLTKSKLDDISSSFAESPDRSQFSSKRL